LNKFSNHLSKSSIKSSTLSLQTNWTTFDLYLDSKESSPLWWKIATARYFNRARMVCSAFFSVKAVVSQVGALQTDLQACGD